MTKKEYSDLLDNYKKEKKEKSYMRFIVPIVGLIIGFAIASKFLNLF